MSERRQPEGDLILQFTDYALWVLTKVPNARLSFSLDPKHPTNKKIRMCGTFLICNVRSIMNLENQDFQLIPLNMVWQT